MASLPRPTPFSVMKPLPHMYTSNSHVLPDPRARVMVISGYLRILPVVLYTPGMYFMLAVNADDVIY